MSGEIEENIIDQLLKMLENKKEITIKDFELEGEQFELRFLPQK